MTLPAQANFSHDEIAQLAYLNWQHDGCPAGQDVKYWLEAECQIKATWHLLHAAAAAAEVAEIKLKTVGVSLPNGHSETAPDANILPVARQVNGMGKRGTRGTRRVKAQPFRAGISPALITA